LLIDSLCVYCYIGVDFFFFSSRRRHTRSKRDWSSDVCSSDLVRIWEHQLRVDEDLAAARTGVGEVLERAGDDLDDVLCGLLVERSEERRVGKECRFRCSLTD